jgi:DNA-binding CsgD family transcriptional regulator
MMEIETTRSLAEDQPHGGWLIERGADLVHLSEELYGRLFVIPVVLLGLSGPLSLVFGYADHREAHGALTIIFAALAIVSSLLAASRVTAIYRWLRRRRWRVVVPGGLAVILVPVNGPYSPSWWISLALVISLAAIVPAGTAVGFALAAAAGYVGGTFLHGASMAPGGSVRYLAAAVGLPVNVLAARLIVEAFARYVLRLHRLERDLASEAERPVRVEDLSAAPMTGSTGRSVVPVRRKRRADSASRLTARQLQVALLLRDGLGHAEIAACLGISPRQVNRLVTEARQRAGAATTSQLVAMLVAGRVAPPPIDPLPD